jgi:hypothetical protein
VNDVERAWKKLAMVVVNSGDRLARFYYQGTLILTTKRSHGSAPIEGNIPYLIRQQMKLSQQQFDSLIACPLGLPEYIDILKKKGWITESTKPGPPSGGSAPASPPKGS